MENKTLSNPVDYETPNSLAAIWSMMLPGLGQMMKGRVMAGIIWAALVASGYFSYFWPGITLHAFCILDAGFYKGDNSKVISVAGIVSALLIYIVIRNYY